MKVLITGSKGFIGTNLIQILKLKKNIEILEFHKKDKIKKLFNLIKDADFIFHLAGVNRTTKKKDAFQFNYKITKKICDIASKTNKKIPILFTSSQQVFLKNSYGISKRKSEQVLINYKKKTGAKIFIYRLPNVFGKWSKPNYNSVIAIFCYNISRKYPIKV